MFPKKTLIMKMTQCIALALAAVLLFHVSYAQAQAPAPVVAAPAATPASSTDRMEQFRQKMNEYLKTSLKVSDEEWSVIQPLLEKVQTKLMETRFSRSGFPSNRRNGGDRNPASTSRPAAPEADALKTALDTEGASPAEIKTRLEAVRVARKKALAELEQSREELRKVLTLRQEAVLVMMGVLE
jgi:hypothetical protein